MAFEEYGSARRHPLGIAGRGAPVTCARCGCRLRPADEDGAGGAWLHFAPLGGRDARGCRVDCAEVAHDVTGNPLAAVA